MFAPICNGELVDKLTILKIKMEKMDGDKLINVTKEYNLLLKQYDSSWLASCCTQTFARFTKALLASKVFCPKDKEGFHFAVYCFSLLLNTVDLNATIAIFNQPPMYEHYSPATLRIFCNPFDYPHKFFKKFHKILVKRLTGGILPVLVNAQADVQGIRTIRPLPIRGPIPFNVVGKRQTLEISTSHQQPTRMGIVTSHLVTIVE